MLTGVAELLLTDGTPAGQRSDLLYGTDEESARRRGVKQGVRMIMLMIVLAPIIGLLSRFVFQIIPWPMGVAVFLLGGGGLLRIIYALAFESGQPKPRGIGEAERKVAAFGANPTRQLEADDASQYIRPSLFNTPDTNDLQPQSVTDETTALLRKERG